MKELEKIYSILEDFKKYLPGYEKREKELKEAYEKVKEYVGEKILDLACGGGILEFILEKDGKKAIGIDELEKMIQAARQHAKKIKSECKFIKGDIRKIKLKEKFDTVFFMGNALDHFTVKDFAEILKNFEKNLNEKATWIIEYGDIINLLFSKQWKDVMVYDRYNATVAELTMNYDCEKGLINKYAFISNGKKLKFGVPIWAPFILESLMNFHGFQVIKREKGAWDYIDVYRKIQ